MQLEHLDWNEFSIMSTLNFDWARTYRRAFNTNKSFANFHDLNLIQYRCKLKQYNQLKHVAYNLRWIREIILDLMKLNTLIREKQLILHIIIFQIWNVKNNFQKCDIGLEIFRNLKYDQNTFQKSEILVLRCTSDYLIWDSLNSIYFMKNIFSRMFCHQLNTNKISNPRYRICTRPDFAFPVIYSRRVPAHNPFPSPNMCLCFWRGGMLILNFYLKNLI